MKNLKGKCRCKVPMWNLKVGDITDYKITQGCYKFLCDTGTIIEWGGWGKSTETFLQYFELLDIDIKQDKSHNKVLIKLIKHADK